MKKDFQWCGHCDQACEAYSCQRDRWESLLIVFQEYDSDRGCGLRLEWETEKPG